MSLTATPSARHAAPAPVWIPAAALTELELPADLSAALFATLGVVAPPEPDVAPSLAPGRVIVITGAAGAGKSSVAQQIAERLERGALVSLDQLWHSVVSGAPLPSWRGGDEAETRRFVRLTLQNAAAMGRNFSGAGFDCVIEGVLESTEELDALLQALGPIETYFVTLVPQLDALLQRDQGREPEQRMGERSAELHAIFQFNGEWRGMRVDSTGLSPEETATLILESLDDARVN